MGLMGAGKSTLSGGLAAALGRPLHDSDAEIIHDYGVAAVDIAKAQGAAALHAIEARVALEALAGPPSVIAAAASTIDVPEVRDALDDAVVVWIDGPIELLAKRFSSGPHRPIYGETLEVLRAQSVTRGPLFAAAADVVVDADQLQDDQLAYVIGELKARGITRVR